MLEKRSKIYIFRRINAQKTAKMTIYTIFFSKTTKNSLILTKMRSKPLKTAQKRSKTLKNAQKSQILPLKHVFLHTKSRFFIINTFFSHTKPRFFHYKHVFSHPKSRFFHIFFHFFTIILGTRAPFWRGGFWRPRLCFWRRPAPCGPVFGCCWGAEGWWWEDAASTVGCGLRRRSFWW
jgi:hypothetical protein